MSEWLRGLSRAVGELVDRRAVTGSEAEPLLGLSWPACAKQAGSSADHRRSRPGCRALTAEDFLERAIFDA